MIFTAVWLISSTSLATMPSPTQSLSAAIRDRGHPPRGTEQYYAGTLGGPLLFPHFGEGKPMWRYDGRQRTFFFAAWQEQFRSASTQASGLF